MAALGSQTSNYKLKIGISRKSELKKVKRKFYRQRTFLAKCLDYELHGEGRAN